ncbi:methylaspartate ammonia-lyase [Parapusillimonas granuli]|uniref:methylaspartate ammonia-lyase n=1 Tax=Parapusillimonas granuli TaxID=380911 RepID=A0A853FVI6_9BURK|nr:methylaspartate ammonia-lyase [Parapusillimonas granuli]MBB5216517.1 methylaspartate ammonia-lyase [Parapusillimonas granuli]NYT48177.1 methylaspartate ammonia-lyase [Parapusillimonas granuli]
MKIQQVITAVGRHGFVHKDLAAIKLGARANGFLFEGPAITPGFQRIVQPGKVLSIMLKLEDGSIAHGDCVDVIFAGAAGRDPLFAPDDHLRSFQEHVAPRLIGRDTSSFAPLAREFDELRVDGKKLHTAIRYGLSQAFLHAAALSTRELAVQVVDREFHTGIGDAPIPILVSVAKTDQILLDRMILKRVPLLPHASFTVVETDLGHDGHKLLDFAQYLSDRIRQIGDADYLPRIHLDTYGTLGELFGADTEAMADYLARIQDTVAPYPFLIESPIIAATREDQIERYAALRDTLRRKGIDVRVIVDEWCNTLEDIQAFSHAQAADMVQIKLPDLGSLTNTIEAALFCNSAGLGYCLGGTANETDQSSRLTTHVALACRPDFILAKPGLGGDEALMIQENEMRRTIAILEAA